MSNFWGAVHRAGFFFVLMPLAGRSAERHESVRHPAYSPRPFLPNDLRDALAGLAVVPRHQRDGAGIVAGLAQM